jgi:hypothetical protein
MSGEQGLPTYPIDVWDKSEQRVKAIVGPVDLENDPLNAQGWSFDWTTVCQECDWDCEALIKVQYQQQIQGLMRLAIYPYGSSDQPDAQFCEVRLLEACRAGQRLVIPVGKWLIWYACKISFEYCTGTFPQNPPFGLPSQTYVYLEALQSAYAYYTDKIGMERLEISTPILEEKIYAFRFTKEQAENFCETLEQAFS